MLYMYNEVSYTYIIVLQVDRESGTEKKRVKTNDRAKCISDKPYSPIDTTRKTKPLVIHNSSIVYVTLFLKYKM